MNRGILASIAPILASVAATTSLAQSKPLPHRVFAKSRFDIDRILARPYDREVPFGASGDRVWATSPQGWGFDSGVNVIYFTNLKAFDPEVKVGGVNYVVKRAEYFPSHVHMIGGPGSAITATASFTYSSDDPNNPLSRPFKPEKRWTCWSSGKRQDWYEVDFGRPRNLSAFSLGFFDDQATGGGCAFPESYRIDLYQNGHWRFYKDVGPYPSHFGSKLDDGLYEVLIGSNPVAFERAERVRLTFRNRGIDKYTGLYGFDPHFSDSDLPDPKASAGIQVTGDKWITQDDVLVSEITVQNNSPIPQSVWIDRRSDDKSEEVSQRVVDVQGQKFYLVTTGPSSLVGGPGHQFQIIIHHGQKIVSRVLCAIAPFAKEARDALERCEAQNAVRSHVTKYQSWFDDNIASYRCSDPRTEKMYYHRWYNVKKNSMYPHLGALHYRTFAEGRWTADWYANVISYGAAHQVRESRWLRDPTYTWGHVQTWADQKRPDGIYPSHITPLGQQGGQYTDWITASAWDAQLVHPSRQILSRIAPSLGKNVDGWKKVYGWGGSPLLAVDSHWWTGMEWQPSFFAFADYKTGGGSGADSKYQTPLRRVDLTAYNYGNAQAVANIYRFLGRTDYAEPYQKLADETRDAVVSKMWDPASNWFVSLRASDDAKDPAKEIIGLYPFYFDLPPAGRGFEKAWDVAVNPALFWTTYPLASVAKDCPAYSQSGWPVGPGGSGCMWNGPTWPHANSIVMTAMANTLRHYPPCSLTRQHLFDLFDSFTRAQYKNGDFRYPWTGEYYNGDTGDWKTTQRDYNHSTWVDPLIHDLLGLVARNDDILEIDPLVPESAWKWWCLDGQSYRGHDVTIAWDANGGHVAPGFKGFAVYLDGKRIATASHPVHLLYDMRSTRLISTTRR